MNNILFSEFKKDFYSRVKDFSLFDCMEFNLLKVVLDGLLVRYTERGKISNYFSYPAPVYEAVLMLKNLRAKVNPGSGKIEELDALIRKHRGKKYLFNASYDLVHMKKSGKRKPFLFHSIVGESNQSNVVFCVERNSPGKTYADIELDPFKEIIISRKLDSEEEEILAALKKTFRRTSKSGIFSRNELKNISISFELFFLQFRLWRYVVNGISPKKFFFRCHYHREGILLACKRAGVTSIEFQHGLIAPEDIFYMMPENIAPVRDRALFADRIWVYGNFWKERLKKGCEYPENKIDVIGYYPYDRSHFDPEKENKTNKEYRNKAIILIATQTFAHKYFIEYTAWLAGDLLSRKDEKEYLILLKPHPNEQKGIYDELKKFPNVRIVDTNIDLLLSSASVLISIYSTVIYEARRYNVPCFSLCIDEYRDYIESFVQSGISNKLMPFQNPLSVTAAECRIASDDLFGKLNNELIAAELS